MTVFRTRRPLLVDATQCAVPTTITTDTGFRHVESGDWIIHGEDGETYVVDDAFFQRTYVAVDTDLALEDASESLSSDDDAPPYSSHQKVDAPITEPCPC